jgi:uncharacterized phage-associated protein
MPIGSAANLLLLLLYANECEDIKGITRLEKLMYLLLKEGGFEEELKDDIHFEAYDFGPFSPEVYDVLEALKEKKIIQSRSEKYDTFGEVFDELLYRELEENPPIISSERTMEVYSLTEDKGMRLIQVLNERGKITEEDLKKVEQIKSKYNGLKLNDLLKYVYETYPESTKKSKIFNKIVGFGRRPNLKPFKREEEENGTCD